MIVIDNSSVSIVRLFSLTATLSTAAGFVPVSMWYSDPGHTMRLFSLTATLSTAAGFVPVSMWYSDPGHTFDEVVLSRGAINRLWDFPNDIWSQEGLGGGITCTPLPAPVDPRTCDS